MPIDVDTSVTAFSGTPSETGSIVSASFTPPNGCILCCLLNIQESPGPNGLTVSGGGLTWTKRVERNAADGNAGGAAIWTAPVGVGASMTVTVTRDGSGDVATRRTRAKVYILKWQHASPIGASNKGAWTVDETTGSITATGPGRLLGVGTDNAANGAPDSQGGQIESTFHNAAQLSGESVHRDVDHVSGTVGIIFDADLTSTPAGNWAVLEILAAQPAAMFGAIYPRITSRRRTRII